MDSTEEDAAIDLGSDAIWELYADGCPGYQWRDPNQAQEPDDLPVLTAEDMAIANQLEADLLQWGPGKDFAYPLIAQRVAWTPLDALLPTEEALTLFRQQSEPGIVHPVAPFRQCSERHRVKPTPDLVGYLEQLQVRKQEVIRQAGGDRSPLPSLTTIVVTTPEGDCCFQFNGAYIDELVPAEGNKVQRVSIRSTKSELWYDQKHLEVMQALYALENAIRRMVGVPEESWDDEPNIGEFGVSIVGIDSDASDVQQVFE